jgi:hypothetical protein
MSKKRAIEVLNSMYESGELKILIDNGILAPSIYKHRNIYNTYLIFLNKTNSKMQAMSDVACNFDCSIEQVRKIRKRFD